MGILIKTTDYADNTDKENGKTFLYPCYPRNPWVFSSSDVEFFDGFTFVEGLDGPSVRRHQRLARIDAQRLVDGAGHVGGGDRPARHVSTLLVGGTDDLSAAH